MRNAWRHALIAGVLWAAGFAAMAALDGSVDLANLAMVLVATSALAAPLLPAWAGVLAGAGAVVAFNWCFVEPRHTLAVGLAQHAWLLLAIGVVNTLVAVLMARQRRHAEAAADAARREAALREFGERLRDSDDPLAEAGTLRTLLEAAAGVPATVLVATAGTADTGPCIGAADANQRAGLAHCVRQGHALGPGSLRHVEQPDTYLPLRGAAGRSAAQGAALLHGLGARRPPAVAVAHLQGLCDQLGAALHRRAVQRAAAAADERAQAQGVRNALLAALSHDFRTPLATILGAATSLQDQAAQLAPEPRRVLAARIADEARRLARMTENALQLARLDAPGVPLRCDWESAEELIGAVMRHARTPEAQARLRVRLEPGLPLVWCDPLLIAQLLDNLIDNALKYSPDGTPVEVLARRHGDQLVLAVRDRGPGIAPASRDQVFEPWQRGAEPMAGRPAAPERPGSGVGLAVCRAIAQAHGGELRLRARGHGGSAFECWLPVREVPAVSTVDA